MNRWLWLVTTLLMSSCANLAVDNQRQTIHIVALNDFHGYIQSSPYTYADSENPGETITVQAGGISAISGLMRELRFQHPELLFVAAGDLIGASPPMSAMFADEPSLLALDMLGLDLSSIGNHELDEGKVELYRQIDGGCKSPRPDKACQYRETYSGIEFDYVAANLIDEDKQDTAVPPYVIRQSKGVDVAFVGGVVQDLSTLIPIASHAGFSTLDEAEAINAVIPDLQAQDVDVIVAVIHEGGFGHAGANDCRNLSGPIVDIAQRLDPAVDVLITGHTHVAYICQVGDLLVTQGHHYGHLLTHLQVALDASGEIENISAKNLLVDPTKYSADPQIAQLEADLILRTSNVLNRPIAKIGALSIDRRTTDAGESAMGNLVADAQLFATERFGAQIAMQNYGGIRADLLVESENASVTYTQVAAVHPFKGTMQTINLTGTQIAAILEQQWPEDGDFNPLQISKGFTYTWDAAKPRGERVVIDSLKLDGEPVLADQLYRVVASGFLMDGGDGFTAFAAGINRSDTGVRELIALEAYLVENDKMGRPVGRDLPEGRVTRIN
jgi:5'-nucleotidase